ESATGTITDASALTVMEVTSDTQAEGETLTHTVTLSGTSVNAETFAFSLDNVTTDSSDYENLQFSNGVTYDSVTGLLTVPAGVSSFAITVDAVSDANVEGNESYDVMVGTESATGTITDASALTVMEVTSDTQSVGGTRTHRVPFCFPTRRSSDLAFSLDNVTTDSSDYENL